MAESKQYYYDSNMVPLTSTHTITNGFFTPVRHLHSQYEFLYIRSGIVTIESNADQMQVEGPCFVVHRPFSLHRATVEKDQKYDRYVINCTKDVLDKISALVTKFSVIDSHSLTVIKISQEMDVILVEYLTKIHAYTLSGMQNLATVYLAILLINLTEYAERDNLLPTPSEGYIGDVVHYIGQNYAENITIDHLSDIFYVSRSKLIADFKKHIKVSIKQYTMLMRVYNAQRFLKSGKSISETAYLCGFYDESHFVGTFHSLTGVTPKAFLKTLES